ncbi:hypothetical protein NLJ89_g2575 [Agrocybe chaxingu]|uniref:Protein kinase domain-containing protein n=1 Tax=Agrocybe chaxingu TaxID=84603 RepID=A0A9W8MY05_9AGAR|nr:hypothetical protein NLJ89_g2575 [Agrocybe chaxingu]
MSAEYGDQDKRRDTGLGLLNDIVGSGHGAGRYTLTAAAIGRYRSDGHTVGLEGVPLTVVEFKNKLANITSDPCVEAVAYVTQLHITMQNGLGQGWRLPCLVVTIVGHTVTFYATVLLKTQHRVVSLTPTLSCLPSASSGRDLDTLRLAFAAMIDLRNFIIADINRHSNDPPHGVPSEYVRFQIKEYFDTWQSHRGLYIADMPKDTGSISTILVKFSRTYSVDLHDYCFRAGHAPKLLAYEALPGGWYGIAMEFLPDTECLDATSATRFEAELTELVNGFHQQGWVHGDLRDANIRCRGDEFWVIDFDWGGKDGEVKYPATP